LTPERRCAEEDRRLTEFGLGITNLCPRATRTAAELSAAERERGARTLERKVFALGPRGVVLVGLSLCPVWFGRGAGGPGAKPDGLAGVPLFVLPNPSGLNASYPGFRHKLVWF